MTMTMMMMMMIIIIIIIIIWNICKIVNERNFDCSGLNCRTV
jgi:flagellar biogenesis protein FliO